VMLAELAAANGVPLYDEGGGAVSRLVGRVLDGFEDPISFGTQVGAVQDIRLPPRKTDLAWAEPYFARFHEPRLARWIAEARPLRDVRLGGDTTAAFGVPSL
jgi:poly(beta-D-mannuronate) lyase